MLKGFLSNGFWGQRETSKPIQEESIPVLSSIETPKEKETMATKMRVKLHKESDRLLIPPIDKNWLKTRFLNKINKVESGCHEWTGCLSGGHPVAFYKKRLITARKIACRVDGWPIENIPWRTITSCNNKICINPNHIINTKDAGDITKKMGQEIKKPINMMSVPEVIRELLSQVNSIKTDMHAMQVSNVKMINDMKSKPDRGNYIDMDRLKKEVEQVKSRALVDWAEDISVQYGMTAPQFLNMINKDFCNE